MGGKRVRTWLAVGLLAVIGWAAYWIGLNLWGDYHRRAFDVASQRRDFAAAQSELAKCLWVWPNRAELHLLSARTARRQDNLPEALRRLRLCHSDSGLREAIALERCLLQIQQGGLGDSTDLDAYCQRFPQAHEAMLIDEAQIMGSLAALDVPRARQYLDLWNQRRQLTADRVQGLLWQATAHVLSQEVEQATACCRQALELDSTSRQARLRLSQMLAYTDPEEAKKHLEVLGKGAKADPDVLYQQAVVSRNLGQPEAAEAKLKTLLEAAPEHVDGLVLRGRVALDQGRLEEAGRWILDAEKLAPHRHAVLVAMIDYLRLTGRGDQVAPYERRLQEVVGRVRHAVEAGGRSTDGDVDQQVIPPRPPRG